MSKVKELLISPGPHIWNGITVNRLMYLVALTLLLPAGASVYYFGYQAIWLIVACVLSAVATEYGVKKLRKKPFIMDGSAVITGLLFALTLPPSLPVWMAVIGSVFAIAIVKEAFGGLGHNIFNPALGARAFMALCFPVEMTSWTSPAGFAPDAITTATPLGDRFIWDASNTDLYREVLFGNIGGSLGETAALFIIIGGLILILTKVIDWRIPFFYLGTVAVFILAIGGDVTLNLLTGGLMLGAFFMATDYVTSPITTKGRVIFAIGAGVVTVLIREYGGMNEGVCFSILFMNALSPLIDRLVKTRPYGLVKKAKSNAKA